MGENLVGMFLKRVVLAVAAASCILGAIWVSHSVLAASQTADTAVASHAKDNHHHSDSRHD
jgi:hypothetical protein